MKLDAAGPSDPAAPPRDAAAAPGADPELAVVRAQVDQARAILSDAVEKMCRCFRTMEVESKLQKHLMATLIGSLSGGSPSAPRPGPPAGFEPAGNPELPGDPPAEPPVDFGAFSAELGSFLCESAGVLVVLSQQNAESLRQMDAMVSQLDGVFSLVKHINGIADETYILAVNAQLEAARVRNTGEGGSGFSVIAANVRELSQKTRHFNAQIAEQVGKARTTVHGVRQSVAGLAVQHERDAASGRQSSDSLMRQLRQLQAFIRSGMTRANTSAAAIGQAASEATSALQFEDILSQLLTSIGGHAEHLRGSSAEGRADRDPPHVGLPPADHAFSYRPVGHAPPEASVQPVLQRDMTAGTVELF